MKWTHYGRISQRFGEQVTLLIDLFLDASKSLNYIVIVVTMASIALPSVQITGKEL